MRELYELKEKLCEELKEYGDKEMSAGSLEVVDKLAHAIKNIDKIIEGYEESEYSGRSYARGGRSNRGRSNEGGSYESSRGRSNAARRDSRGRYSREYSYDDEMISELRELMEDAPDERTKQEFRRFIQKIESM